MPNQTNLVITGMPAEWATLFKNLCDALELSRDQLLILLMIQNGTTTRRVEEVVKAFKDDAQWRELVLSRALTFATNL